MIFILNWLKTKKNTPKTNYIRVHISKMPMQTNNAVSHFDILCSLIWQQNGSFHIRGKHLRPIQNQVRIVSILVMNLNLNQTTARKQSINLRNVKKLDL